MQPRREWAGGLGDAELTRLCRLLEDGLRSRGLLTPTFDLEEGVASVSTADGIALQLGLTNLAQSLAQRHLDEWPALIERHLAGLPMPGAFELPAWPDVAGMLRLRLFGAQPEGAAVARQLGPELWPAAVVDLPTALAIVTAGDLERWGVAADEIWQRALRAMDGEPLPDPSLVATSDGDVIECRRSDSFLLSARGVLALAQLAAGHPRGALFVAPSRNTFLLHRLTEQTRPSVLEALQLLAAHLYRAGPGSVTPLLFWWDGSAIQAIAAEAGSRPGTIDFELPAELALLLGVAPLAPRRSAVH